MDISNITTLQQYIPLSKTDSSKNVTKIYSDIFMKYMLADFSLDGGLDASKKAGMSSGIWKGFLVDQLAQQFSSNHNNLFAINLAKNYNP